jgi:hypothetical protein
MEKVKFTGITLVWALLAYFLLMLQLSLMMVIFIEFFVFMLVMDLLRLNVLLAFLSILLPWWPIFIMVIAELSGGVSFDLMMLLLLLLLFVLEVLGPMMSLLLFDFFNLVLLISVLLWLNVDNLLAHLMHLFTLVMLILLLLSLLFLDLGLILSYSLFLLLLLDLLDLLNLLHLLLLLNNRLGFLLLLLLLLWGRPWLLLDWQLLDIDLLGRSKVYLLLLCLALSGSASSLDLRAFVTKSTLELVGVSAECHDWLRLASEFGWELSRVASLGHHLLLVLELFGLHHSLHDLVHAFDLVDLYLWVGYLAIFIDLRGKRAFLLLHIEVIVVLCSVLLLLVLALLHSWEEVKTLVAMGRLSDSSHWLVVESHWLEGAAAWDWLFLGLLLALNPLGASLLDWVQ